MQLPSFSILPASLVFVEVWLVRLFIFLAVVSIVPLLLFFIYDFFLYIWRSVTYELPFIGGRARGKRRPRAPSLADNPAGRRIKAIVHDLQYDSDEAISTGAAPHAEEQQSASRRQPQQQAVS